MTKHDLQGVSQTLLIPLYVRAMEARREDALLRDDTAARIVGSIVYDFSRLKLKGHDMLGIVLRAREFDRFVRDFLSTHSDGVVIHIGCGLDTRFQRVDNGQVEWYDLDLPEVIDLRRKLLPAEGRRHHHLACSVFDPAWMDTVMMHMPRPFLFVAEGVFPYFKADRIKSLVLELQHSFPGAELVFDASRPWVIPSDNLQLFLSGAKARLHFALKHGQDVELWSEGIRMLEEWFYFGTDEARVRRYRWMHKVGFLRKSVGIFHYRLGG